MKFEPPIAEIELFPIKDIISASNDDTGEDISTQPTVDTRNYDSIHEPICFYDDFRDNDNWDTCL